MVRFIRSDLDFILNQILIAERQAAGENLLDILPNAVVPWGLRTISGQFNNLTTGHSNFGAADHVFPRMLDPFFRTAENVTVDLDGPGPLTLGASTSYQQTSGYVFDSQPRTISNLIADQTDNNPAATAAAAANPGSQIVTSPGLDGVFGTADDRDTNFIPNITPDEGLSAPFNSWMTFFGQFFDHGLDLVTKGGSGTVFIPLQPDDPLYVVGSPTNFMVVTRATNQPGPDGILGNADDIHEHENTTSPFVDQNQTYSSHPSHQVFLRAYEFDSNGDPVATGKLLTNRDLGADGEFDGAPGGDDTEIGGMATWKVLKAQAHDVLGINLTDADFDNVPLLRTDDYGNFIRGPNGFPLVVTGLGPDGIPNTADDVVIEGDPSANGGLGISLATAVRTGHQFLIDVAHNAVPFGDHDGNPATPAQLLTPDADGSIGGPVALGFYDNELLDAHYMAGDGRVNENIGLTAVHAIFHSEHNRLVDQTKAEILENEALTPGYIAPWLATGFVFTAGMTADQIDWNGERLFQAAKFGTEMQYQHLLFEEFARRVQPNIDEFLAPEGYDVTIDPSIVAEFAHTVYRFGHSMLTETIDRFDPDFNVVGDGNPTEAGNQQSGLIAMFLNPLAYAASGADPDAATGAIVRGVTRQVGNEIDEFVTEALRNNLVGLPLDLPAINIARGRDTGIPSLNAARATFYEATGDSQLKPYASWVDFLGNLKHAESLVNFIAAYGTHDAITSATTLADKRAAAMALVLGDGDDSDGVDIGGTTYTDRLDFLNATGAHAGGSLGGLNNIDFWIGGLAEKQMPFGGLLGSTFNFVFETQLESLQNGDRFYYLSRTAGMHFGAELENNSFAALVMRNSDATHLPADIFSTPAFTLEVNASQQFTGLGADNRADPTGGIFIGDIEVAPLVVRDDLNTAAVETNYLRYNGADHVVLGGTAGDDTIIASIGDDTLYGDAGNDRLEGGDGVDNIFGGAGDDIITDWGGDDVLRGEAGNDVITGGNGLNILFGGDGSDFIITGEDVSTTFGGTGNDFILGSMLNLPTFGNEGDDWIEIGTSDGAGGDNFDPLEAGTVIGNDVFITGTGFDEVDGEGGDDIMVGSDGEDHFGGGGGFDWASYKFDQSGVTVDFNVNDFIEPLVAPSAAGVLDRFAQVEGLSGSALADVLRGDDADAAQIDIAGAQNSALTNIGLIAGLQALLGAGVTRFASGNIILGGGGSDIIEGRGGDDLIDGDSWLNVKINVYAAGDVNHTGAPIRTVDSMIDLIPDMLSGAINPGQLQATREILAGAAGFDTAVFSGNLAEYDFIIDDNGTAGDLTDDIYTVVDSVAGRDGSDTLKNIERLQFADQAVPLPGSTNSGPEGQLTIDDETPSINQVLHVSALGITDADNPGTGAITGPISYVWQFEAIAGSGVFQDIVNVGGGNPATAGGTAFKVTADLNGLALRVRAIYQDANGVLENVYSAPTVAVSGTIAEPPPPVIPAESPVVSPGNGVHLIRADLQFILDQILISEQQAGGASIRELIPNVRVPFGLRTVDGSLNNLVNGQSEFGAADNAFPRLLDPFFLNDGDGDFFDANGPAPGGLVINTNYGLTGNVADADPRTISNLIVDQTVNNPAAYANAYDPGIDGILHTADDVLKDGVQIVQSPGLDGVFGTTDDRDVFFFPNVTPDEGLSAPFNTWMTFFGQFFDHGLDLLTKGGSGTVYIPLAADDPLVAGADGIFGNADDLPAQLRFMALTRATNQPGPDGILGNADDIHEHENTTSPFVDQNQTYTSHPSHQVFLRAYEMNAAGDPMATGKLITNRDLGADGEYGTADDAEIGGMATWKVVKAQARDMLGINLTDADFNNVPLLRTDAYGNFIRGPNGFPMVVTGLGPDGIPNTTDDVVIEGDPSANGGLGISLATALRTGHAFLNDIAHNAVPGTVFDTDGNPATPGTSVVQADADNVAGNAIATDFAGRKVAYDNELLDAHYIAGDGRVNENIGLTAVHSIFHSEHNRLVEHTKDVILASNDPDFIANWQLPDGSWNGERLFQAAKFGTEMQYQHLVFEEFARRVQPQVDAFLAEGQGYDTTIDAAIVAEFAHTVYRFGHSMLTETIDRLDPDFQSSEIGLITAFLNPLAFAASGPTPEQATGAIVRGVTRQVGNEIDEFVTEALRNNLVGLPLDLPAINIARGRDTGIPSLNAARREFYTWTGDSQLKPYSSWADFMTHLKHPESLINFIAAYGVHASLTGATTLADKRAAATLLVLDGAGAPGDRIDFLNSTGAYANLANGATITGLDAVDLWIGGLAEAQMPFGGLLGSTFNYVFENQLEKLQNADRFYYLERTAGLNFLTELENNSFAKLIMANTDATHLPGDVFSTPAFTLEVNPLLQHTGLGVDGRADPTGGNPLLPIVIRNNPDTAGPDINYLRYTGEDHVVLGGTAGNDIIFSSIGDDTLYGDAGNDRLDGGDGVDMILGNDGDDIITDRGGEDNLQGGNGNDAIHGGNSIDLILGGFGNDFIVTGEDGDESFGGTGNDFILGDRADEMVFGNEGDDWLEHGMADGSAGENFDTRGLDSIIGHDVFVGDSVADRMLGEGGDDIMIGGGGTGDRYIGGSGFDWASFQSTTFSANVDFDLRAFNEAPIPQSAVSVLARFESIEGLSGSSLSDILRGDSLDAAAIAISGNHGSVMTAIGLIGGMQTFLNSMLGGVVTSFGAGNIILGGNGSDIVEGRGGDDLIDGDQHLDVHLAGVDNNGVAFTATSMTEIQQRVFAGEINPGNISIVREILPGDGSFNFDTAVFSSTRAEYEVSTVAGVTTVAHRLLDGAGVIIAGSTGADGTDTLRGVERLQFADQAIVLSGTNNGPSGLLSISDTTPQQGAVLTVSSAGVTDADNTSTGGTITGSISYIWQFEKVPGSGSFADILIPTGLGDVKALGPTFTVSDAALVGLRLRTMAIYQDQNGVLEVVFSAPTEPVQVPGTPEITSNGGGATAEISYNENATAAVTTVTATDPNIGDVPTFSISGGADETRFSIDATTGALTFIAAPNFESPTDTGLNNTYEVIVRAFDGLLADTQTITVNVLDVNDPIGATTDANAATNAADENSAAGTVVGITAQAVDEDALDTVTYSLTDNAGGRFAIDPLTGVVTVAGAVDRESFGPTASITVLSTSTDGSISTETFTIGINDVDEFDVSAIVDNDPAAEVVDENAGIGTAVGITAFASDADATTNAITYSLSSNPGGLFTIDPATGVVTTAAAIDREAIGASVAIEVTATSADGSSSVQSYTIDINDIDEFDVSVPVDNDAAANAVDENVAIGSAVGITAFASDADATTNAITYSLTSNPGGLFTIDPATGVVTTAAAIDREAIGASVAIEVTATSADGSSSVQSYTIDINDIDEFDVSVPVDNDAAANAVDENVAIGTAVGITAFASDADATTNAITYSLTSNPGGLFTIDPATGVVTTAAAIDREAIGASVAIEVTATSADGSSSVQSYTIAINDLDEFDVSAIVDNDPAAEVVDENAGIGTAVGITAFASDADATTNAITYSLSSNPGGLFTIDPATGVVTTAAAIDREAIGASVAIEVTATSADGSSSVQSYTIDINDIDEFDVSVPVDNDAAANAVDENVAIGTAVGITAFASDADATTNAITYSLSSNPGGLFTIDPATGVVTTAAAIDREAIGASVAIEVTATSADGSSSVQSYTIAINDIDEFDVSAIVDNDPAAEVVDENAGIGTAVGITAFASDADATTNAITYSLSSNPGGLFTIDPATGVVTTAAAIDREAIGASVAIEVTATSADGSSSVQSYTIAINDLDEFDVSAIVDNDPAAEVVDENAGIGTAVGITAFASDADATTNAITYSLSSNPGGLFTIDPATGVVTTAAAIDREAIGASVAIEVTATSADGSSSVQSYTIDINDIDEFDVSPVVDNDAGLNQVLENSANGTVIGVMAFASDGDATNNAVTYSLTDNAGGRFAIDSVTGVVTVAGALDFESITSHDITVQAQSSDGSAASQSFTINVLDEAPVINDPAGDGDGTVFGTPENDRINGLGGNDILTGGALPDTLDGGLGSDTASYATSGAAVQINLLAGSTGGGDAHGDILISIENLIGSAFGDTLFGDLNLNVLEGGAGADSLRGFDGNDSIIGGLGNDTAYGGIGDDTMDGGGDDDTFLGEAGNDTMSGGDGLDRLYGGDDSDSLNGDAGNDIMEGGAGNDTVDGGTGNDNMRGNAGDDIFILDSNTDVVVELFNEGTDEVRTSSSSTYLSANVENLLGTGLNQFLAGNNLDNIVIAGAGNDSLRGYDGNDTITGNAGNDVAYAGTGNDTLNGGLGDDSFLGEAGNDILNGGDDVDRLYGGADDDTLNGDAGNDIMEGGSGNDFVDGGTGNDNMRGNAGDDIFIFDSSTDVVVELAGEGIDEVRSTAALQYLALNVEKLTGLNNSGQQLYGNVNGDIINAADGADIINGYAGNDTIFGGGGGDNIRGGADDDRIDGGLGSDILFGGITNNPVGSGNDTFVEHGATGYDGIYDFGGGAGAGDLVELNTMASGGLYASSAVAFAALQQIGGNVFLQVDADSGVWFLNRTIAQMNADDFVLVA